jgi:hypothetical protein
MLLLLLTDVDSNMEAIELARRSLYATSLPTHTQPQHAMSDSDGMPNPNQPCTVSSLVVQRLVVAVCILIIITTTNAIINVTTMFHAPGEWHNDSSKLNMTLVLFRNILSQLNAPHGKS